ncbi:hypothetical protein KIN20_033829 [Parelaphostrongylus tenuis]|uniref:Uncharacterized protein n=1 Tax=Parelaphostrongylus tenuis TaxID=148309 RepID=A0AAD5R8Y2_PARTN|nr:hypothetical protein KIN20_033829 [Parelaphostrongylus tenuis]
MELQQSRLKLEVPLSGRASASCAELQCKYLSESLQTSGILFDEVVQTGVEEPGCQGFLVYNYEIKSSSFAEQLLPAIRRFLQIIQEDARHIPHYLKATVIVHSPACFSKEVVSCHRLVPAAAIYFGNIQGGVYMNHWEVSFRNQNACEEMETNFARMYTDFLYDQSEAVCVSFYNEEWGVEPGEGRSSKVKGVAYYLVSVRLSFIRRIMVDNAVTDIRGRDRTRIHLELNCPVMIRRGFVKAKDNTISGHDFNYDVHYYRFCDIKRGRELGEIPHNLAISDSPLFSIELGESLSDKKNLLYFVSPSPANWHQYRVCQSSSC